MNLNKPLAFLILVFVAFVNLCAIVISDTTAVYAYVYIALEFKALYWGALGGVVYDMRTLSRVARYSQFDTRRVESLFLLALLGGILGFTITNLITISDVLIKGSEELAIPLGFTESGVAFLGGFGAKVVFGLLETVVNWLANIVTGRMERK